MDNWKAIGQITSSFGIVFLVFAALAAFFEYETLSYMYGFSIGFLQFSVLSAMLPYLLLSVLSFIVAAAARLTKKEQIKKFEPEQTQLPIEPQIEQKS